MDILDKTNFLNYLICECYGWNVFHRKLPAGPQDNRRLYRAGQGEEVERLGQQLFPDGWEISGERRKAARQTRDLIKHPEVTTLYQATALSPDNLLAKADFTTINTDGSLNLYEVKMVGSLGLEKPTLPADKEKYFNDVTFQKIAFTRSGYRLERVFLIHIDSTYRLEEETIDPSKFLKMVDVSSEVEVREPQIVELIEKARKCYAAAQAPECSCRYKSKKQRCETFQQFNRDIPTKNSVLDISRIRVEKITPLLKRQIYKIEDISPELAEEIGFSDKQLLQIQVTKSKKPLIKKEVIADTLKQMLYPLYFLDYETVSYPIPVFKGARPFQHIVFQFSLHILKNVGKTPQHLEYLMQAASKKELNRLIAELQANIGSEGSIVVWHQAAEKGFHKSLVDLMPEHASFFEGLDERIFDLEEIFSKQDYIHPAMEGKTSLKNAVNILRDSYYGDLDIQEGSLASAAWSEALDAGPDEKEKRFEQLRQYCQRDTLAMVEIYEHLRQLCA